ncbi:pyruvate, water dikinase [Saccharopolyspora sp. HNM0983]|uniref:Pyruvate, water dikinase n=1 Tax=Saccharopolyspora montiporae TaxID=2781240 RepID=A0A929G092_9PSEU|nr:PEP/pyruvate-binding domain-containing protein [Saccharopolyspora sp. HNM0983]MBE9375365.1 pyruvate, water dikinase [Saccharopolyspora sp. HNM0983]
MPDGSGDAVVDLHEVRAGMGDLVGGKAANLGELLAAGERVPAGFCVTTGAFDSGEVPAEAIEAAYRRLGSGKVAVRSSATAEDLPEASFAGQQDTYLDVEGAAQVVDAVRRCWASLDTERAEAYRRANTIDRDEVRMAVVVQRMVDADTAGVLFTADPVTGSRSRTVVEAVRGLGTGVVDGSTEPEHYAVDDGAAPRATSGCLTSAQLGELAAAGRRAQELFGAPQDVEWCHDRDGTLWLVQSRPITTLFPLPPQDLPDMPRLYLEIGHLQGMLRPFTPMGMAMMQRVWERWCETEGIPAGSDPRRGPMVDIGGRLYFDLTAMVRNRRLRGRLVDGLQVYGPRVQAAVGRALTDPRFAPDRRSRIPVSAVLRVAAKLAPVALAATARSLARPHAARARAQRGVQRLRELRGPGADAGPQQRLDWVFDAAFHEMLGGDFGPVLGPTYAGILAGNAPAALLRGVATKTDTERVLGGMPHNVTTEMDLALWRVAERARPHRELFTDHSPAELAERHRSGELPDVRVDAFLTEYGHRASGEVDIGLPRWREDPAPVFAAVANYLRLQDPEQAPDRRFERAAAAARRALAELSARAVRARPVRGRIAAFLMHRSRELAGMREYAKFAWLVPFAEMRRQLVLAGRDLAAAGVLDRAEDIMFLNVDEACAGARDGADLRALVAERRRVHERERTRSRVPGALLSDGTDLEAANPAEPAPDGGLSGMAAAPGETRGRARVIADPVGAYLEPGEILVAATTDPGWTPLFMTAAGLVSETGSPIAHGPTVAREYGIPAVICVRDATSTIRTGDLLHIDGTSGTVEILPEDATTPDDHAR